MICDARQGFGTMALLKALQKEADERGTQDASTAMEEEHDDRGSS